MKLFFLLAIIGSGWTFQAKASFLEPKSCVSLTDEERLAQADIAGYGETTKVECLCDKDATCINTIHFSEPIKGQAGQSVSYHQRFKLDFGVNARYCKEREQQAKAAIGHKDFYYFKNSGEIIPARKCK